MSDWSNLNYPHSFNVPHVINSSRLEGEYFLASLCTQSSVEYAWEYNNAQEDWIFTPGVASRKTIKIPWTNIVISDKNQLEIPDHTLHPSGEDSSHYHIHPDLDEKAKPLWAPRSLPAQLQIPSTEDILLSEKFTNNGYKDMRIVTRLGVTTLKHNPDLIEPGTVRDFKSIKINCKELQKLVDQQGVASAISAAFDRLNEHYDGVFVFTFTQL